MKLTRKVILSALLLTFTSFTFAQQQTVKKNNETKKETQEEETSVEDEYLNDVDGEIITTLADSDEYDNKLVALQYLQAAIDDGNTS